LDEKLRLDKSRERLSLSHVIYTHAIHRGERNLTLLCLAPAPLKLKMKQEPALASSSLTHSGIIEN
jgi:hypothetical protein